MLALSPASAPSCAAYEGECTMKTHTKVFYGVVFALLVMATPFAAQARPGGHGYGYGPGGYGGYGGWHQSLPQEQRDAVWKMMQDHRSAVQPLRDQLWTKTRTLDALERNPKVEPKEIKALVEEIGTLRGQLREQHLAFAAKVKQETGVDVPGAWCGMKGGNFGRDRGGYGHRGGGYGGGGYGHGGGHHGGNW